MIDGGGGILAGFERVTRRSPGCALKIELAGRKEDMMKGEPLVLLGGE